MTDPSVGDGRNRVLLTVSGTIPADLDDAVASGRRPRVDYVQMAAAFHADLVDHAEAERRTGRFGRIVERVAGRNVLLAWCCFRSRREYDVVMTDGEQVGIPFAALLLLAGKRRPRHLMIVHILSVRKKVVPFRLLQLRRRIDELVVYSSAQQRFAVDTLHVAPDRVTLVPFMVDTTFFSPQQAPQQAPPPDGLPVVCSAGLEFRDYGTMVEAVRSIDARVVLAAASPWSKRKSELDGMELPAHVEVVRLDLHQLRQLYADASVVVMPLHESDFQAGVTTLLEAMAMGKPIVCTRTTGQTDVVTDGVTGIYVPVGDAPAMHAALRELLDDPSRARALGAAARQWVVEHADIDVYVELLRRRVAHHRALRS